MGLLEEISEVFHLSINKPIIHCKLFKDNNGVLKLAKVPKLRPLTKHITIKYHHFRAYVESRKIEINLIDTNMQQVDIFTKLLALAQFRFLRKLIMG